MNTFKKVMFIVTIAFMVLVVFAEEITVLQFVPFVVAGALMWYHIYNTKEVSTWISVLALLMFFVNIAATSVVDIIYWVFVFFAFIKK